MTDTTHLLSLAQWAFLGIGLCGLLWLAACIGYRRGVAVGLLDRELDDLLGTGLPYAQLVAPVEAGDAEPWPRRHRPVADTVPIVGLVLARGGYVPPPEPADDIEEFIAEMRRRTDETIAMLLSSA